MNDDAVPTAEELGRRHVLHLRNWLGSWPPRSTLEVVASPLRDAPEWDGVVRPLEGVHSPLGTVVSVPPSALDAVSELALGGYQALSDGVGELLGRPGTPLGGGTYRFLGSLVDLEPLGEWVEPDDERLPSWLRPFNGGILIALDEDGRYAAGVGLKRHDEFASEIAVGTEPEHRGKGLARRLVATAARELAGRGLTATYEHALDNAGSSVVAAAAGFPDLGWRAVHLGTEE